MMNRIPQNLSMLDHFRDDPRVQFKEENVGGVDVVIPCYMIADAQFWTLQYARELRGHTYNKQTGDLMGAALHKFFNVGERADTQPDKINWNELNYPQEKVDGSMINAVVFRGAHGYSVSFKTKKSFYSDVAVAFRDWFWKQPQSKQWEQDIIELWLNHLVSPVFEFYHPDWQVVLDYGSEPRVWWLNARYSEGRYMGVTDGWFEGMSRRGVRTFQSDREVWLPLEAAKTEVNVEGWVLYDEKLNEMFKVKTKWYLDQHRVRTQMRERDVAEMAAQEKLDDVKSLVSAAGLDLAKIEAIEKRVSVEIMTVRLVVEDVVNGSTAETAKEMASYYSNHQFFGMIMQKFRGKEPDYVQWFLRNKLQEFSLKNVYNEKF